MKAIVYSARDIAGTNIAEALTHRGFEATEARFEAHSVFNRGDWDLIRTQSELVYAEQINSLNYDEIVFASRHRAASGQPTLTAHVCGNFGAADLGGKDGELSVASANTMCNIFREIAKYDGEHAVSLECTHHGPLISVPHCWIELGSDERYWSDEKVAEFLADCIIKGIDSREVTPSAIGIGGNHYCSVFSKHEGEHAFGHILPKYAQKHLNKKMLEQMINKTSPEPRFIVIDKKGIAKQSEVRKLCEETGKEVIVL
ncbi:MAG: D-aminoacyl-tRNA deacylase [archaeon]